MSGKFSPIQKPPAMKDRLKSTEVKKVSFTQEPTISDDERRQRLLASFVPDPAIYNYDDYVLDEDAHQNYDDYVPPPLEDAPPLDKVVLDGNASAPTTSDTTPFISPLTVNTALRDIEEEPLPPLEDATDDAATNQVAKDLITDFSVTTEPRTTQDTSAQPATIPEFAVPDSEKEAPWSKVVNRKHRKSPASVTTQTQYSDTERANRRLVRSKKKKATTSGICNLMSPSQYRHHSSSSDSQDTGPSNSAENPNQDFH
jgi:hypothetical protein